MNASECVAKGQVGPFLWFHRVTHRMAITTGAKDSNQKKSKRVITARGKQMTFAPVLVIAQKETEVRAFKNRSVRQYNGFQIKKEFEERRFCISPIKGYYVPLGGVVVSISLASEKRVGEIHAINICFPF